MTAMTDYLENKYIDNLLRTTTFARSAINAHALFTAAPGETGGGTEVTGGAYARIDLPPLDTNYTATQGGTTGVSSGTAGLSDNAVIITFPTPTANWGLVVSWAMFDALTVGNMEVYAALTASKTINNGDPAPTFPIGDLDFTFA